MLGRNLKASAAAAVLLAAAAGPPAFSREEPGRTSVPIRLGAEASEALSLLTGAPSAGPLILILRAGETDGESPAFGGLHRIEAERSGMPVMWLTAEDPSGSASEDGDSVRLEASSGPAALWTPDGARPAGLGRFAFSMTAEGGPDDPEAGPVSIALDAEGLFLSRASSPHLPRRLDIGRLSMRYSGPAAPGPDDPVSLVLEAEGVSGRMESGSAPADAPRPALVWSVDGLRARAEGPADPASAAGGGLETEIRAGPGELLLPGGLSLVFESAAASLTGGTAKVSAVGIAASDALQLRLLGAAGFAPLSFSMEADLPPDGFSAGAAAPPPVRAEIILGEARFEGSGALAPGGLRLDGTLSGPGAAALAGRFGPAPDGDGPIPLRIEFAPDGRVLLNGGTLEPAGAGG